MPDKPSKKSIDTVRRKPRIGLALGGGGGKGWAHIGVLKGLLEHGIVPDVVAGTSIGAVVGGAYVAGTLDELEQWVLKLGWGEVLGLMDFRFSGGLIEGSKLFKTLEQQFVGEAIESLRMPFGAVATDLEHGTEVWLRSGSLRDAVRASAALPGLFSPALIEGQWLVDGGLVNPVPVSLCRALGADIVLAVDLNAYQLSQGALSAELEQAAAGRTTADADAADVDGAAGVAGVAGFSLESLHFRNRFLDVVGGMVGDVVEKFRDSAVEKESVPSMIDVAVRSINIMSIRITRSRLAGDPPEMLLRPNLKSIGLMEFHRAAESIEIGRHELERQLDTVKALKRVLENAQ